MPKPAVRPANLRAAGHHHQEKSSGMAWNPNRGPWGGGGGGGPWGSGPSGGRIVAAAEHRGHAAAQPGALQERSAGRLRRLPRDPAGRPRRAGDLAAHRLLPGAAGRAGRRAAVRPVRQDHHARPELLVPGADRRGADAERRADEPDEHRLSRRQRGHPDRRPRRPPGKRDADRGPEHHRRRLHRAVAHRATPPTSCSTSATRSRPSSSPPRARSARSWARPCSRTR